MLTSEDGIKRAIVDSHIHFWDPDHLHYDWLANTPLINRRYVPSDLLTAAVDVDLQKIVFVEAGCASDQGIAEAEWVTSLAKDEPRIQGIVAFAPLELGEAVRQHLQALSHIPLVKGVRRMIQSEGTGFCLQSDFVRGVQMLPDFGYSFDICIVHHQLGDAIRLVAQCPDVSFVLDHFGKPAVKDGLLDPWREELHTLAQFPNVACKISGLATEADRQEWTRQQLQPYIKHAISTFGPDRILYGGDWPVSTLATGWQQWIDTINWAMPQLDDVARHNLFFENAVKFYRLDE